MITYYFLTSIFYNKQPKSLSIALFLILLTLFSILLDFLLLPIEFIILVYYAVMWFLKGLI